MSHWQAQSLERKKFLAGEYTIFCGKQTKAPITLSANREGCFDGCVNTVANTITTPHSEQADEPAFASQATFSVKQTGCKFTLHLRKDWLQTLLGTAEQSACITPERQKSDLRHQRDGLRS